jgi:hypothetical protein
MTCMDCQDQMLEVARRRAAPLVERAVLAHVDGCPACLSMLERERAVSAGLRALAAADASLEAGHGLEAKLLSAFASERVAQRGLPGVSIRRWLPVAAGLMLSTGLAGWWLTGRAAQPPSQSGAPFLASSSAPSQKASPVPVDASISAVAPPQPLPARAATTRVTTRRARPATPAPVQVTGFMAIPAADGLPDFESGEIVRVGIPVSSLPAYGVEIPPDALSAAVQADFLVGQDGQARAIRLVTNTVERPRPRR